MVRVNKLNLKCLMLIFVIPLITGDVLTHFAKHKNMIRVMEATTEPLNNVSPYEQVQYSVANLSTDFKSSTKFQPRGMAHLYLLTEKFISYIGKEQAFPEGMLIRFYKFLLKYYKCYSIKYSSSFKINLNFNFAIALKCEI